MPLQRHHRGEVAGGHVDAPLIEVEDAHGVGNGSMGQQEIPGVGIAVHDGHMAARMVALEQPRRLFDKAAVELTPPGAQAVAKLAGKARKMPGENLHEILRVVGAHPNPDRLAQAAVVPPRGVQSRERTNDGQRLFG